jgi:hypothetical protein
MSQEALWVLNQVNIHWLMELVQAIDNAYAVHKSWWCAIWALVKTDLMKPFQASSGWAPRSESGPKHCANRATECRWRTRSTRDRSNHNPWNQQGTSSVPIKQSFWTMTQSLNSNFNLFVFIKIFIKKWYRYIFRKVFFKTNLFIWLSYFQTQQLKSYLWFIFSMFDPNLVQNDLFYGYRGSMYL